MTSLSARMLTAQTQETINEEVRRPRARLPARRLAVPGPRRSSARSRQPGANLYLIADPNGRILTGNVESLEPGVLEVEGWTERPFSYRRFGEERERRRRRDGAVGTKADGHRGMPAIEAIALVLRLPNQMIVLVGRDLGEPERFRGGGAPRADGRARHDGRSAALLIWFFVGRRALKRIDSVSQASRRIMGGDLAGRLPVTGAGDEFDRLSENLNAMLARIAELNEGLKQVSDNIAHDLKTPLTRLRNRAEAALAGKPRSRPNIARRWRRRSPSPTS